jgi:hypothetical protein
MMSREKIERYRRMTSAERWKETEALMVLAWEALRKLPWAERQRRLERAGAVAKISRPARRRRGR